MDNDNIDFKKLWKQQKTDAPQLKEFKKKLTKYKNMNTFKSLFIIIGLSIYILLCICIWVYLKPPHISTQLGLLLCIIGMLIYIVQYSQLFSFNKKLNSLISNKDYLNNLMTIKKKQIFIQTKVMKLYYLFLIPGIFLVCFKYMMMLPNPFHLIALVVTIAWLVFSWFYARPKTIKADNKKINDLISQYSKISEQFVE